jgi:lycopene cyclase domain-containing protein
MAEFNYLGVLLFISVCAVGVTVVFKVRAPRFWRTFFIVDSIVLAVYLFWDYWAIEKNIWSFDPVQTTGLKVLGIIPIEEVLFFIIVPLMTIITYLALINLIAKVKLSLEDRARQ